MGIPNWKIHKALSLAFQWHSKEIRKFAMAKTRIQTNWNEGKEEEITIISLQLRVKKHYRS